MNAAEKLNIPFYVHKEDKSNYDFVLDTTNFTREEVVEKVIKAYEEWLKK